MRVIEFDATFKSTGLCKSLRGFNKILISSTDVKNSSNTGFHKDLLSGSRVVLWGRMDGQTYRHN
jgi:hypothetical protein